MVREFFFCFCNALWVRLSTLHRMQQSSLNIRTSLQNGVRSIECRVQGWFRTEHKTDQVTGLEVSRELWSH